MHRARPLRQERVYDHGNNGALTANSRIKQTDNESGVCRGDAKTSLFVIRAAGLPMAPVSLNHGVGVSGEEPN